MFEEERPKLVHLSRPVRRLPRAAGLGVEKLPGALRQQQILGERGLAKPDPGDEILATALKRRHEPQRFASDLLKTEISEKQARSIKYQLTIAKLPLAKLAPAEAGDLDGFAFQDTPINESLGRDLSGVGFIAQQRNVVLIGGIEAAS